MKPRRPRRAQLRTRVLAGVLAVTLVALAAFDVTAVTALRGYLLSQTDGQLQTVLRMYRAQSVAIDVQAQPHGQIVARVSPAQPPQAWVTARGQVPASPRVVRPITRGHSGPPRAEARIAIVGPRLLAPGVLGQYFVVSVSRRGAPTAYVRGGPDLKPPIPAHLFALAASHRPETVTSLNGQAQLRVLASPVPGGSLLAATSLAGVNKTVGRLELIVIAGSAPPACSSPSASPGSCAAACARSRRWPPRPTGSRPATSPTGSARTTRPPRWAASARR